MFIIKGIDISDKKAKVNFDDAEKYLRKSDTAGFVIDNLRELSEKITICVGKKGNQVKLDMLGLPESYVRLCKRMKWEMQNVYIHPKEDAGPLHGGFIAWNPGYDFTGH